MQTKGAVTKGIFYNFVTAPLYVREKEDRLVGMRVFYL